MHSIGHPLKSAIGIVPATVLAKRVTVLSQLPCLSDGHVILSVLLMSPHQVFRQ